jgi:adenylate cyclase
VGRLVPQWLGFFASALIIAGVNLLGQILFTDKGLILREIPLFLGVVVAFPTNLVYHIILTQREKAMIRGMFAQYVPKQVTDALIANPDLAKLGGEIRRMSVLFTDLWGFTTISEGMTPEELVHVLNEYLTAMTNVILEQSGIIDKYEGDLIMAEFGAPVWFEDHAVRACRAALNMQKKLTLMREKWKAEGRHELRSRIGVNTGEMLVGNMGSEQVFDYTVMGDSVNLASRLEGANKNYGTSIMIGRGTWDDVHDKFVTRPLDLLRVKGKKKPVEVFELIAEPGELSTGKKEALEHYMEGMIAYRQRAFMEAGECFGRALSAEPGDGPSEVYHERASQYYLEPPPPDWDGVWELHEK